jgi:hypothetical protein
LRRSRTLQWEGCCNIRDLGGLPLEAGGKTRFGVVVRADYLGVLSEHGWRALRDYGVRRIVDLRHEDDSYRCAVPRVAVPLLDDESLPEIDELLARVDDPIVWRRRNYLFMLERFSRNFARAVSEVARTDDGATLVHCAGGIDRTGLVSALLLRVAGVGLDAIGSDYAESEAGWKPTMAEWIDAAPDEAERRKRRMLSVISAQAMHDVLLDLEREHGSTAEYLVRGGGTREDLERVRARLTDR